jgi:hypothetical protein
MNNNCEVDNGVYNKFVQSPGAAAAPEKNLPKKSEKGGGTDS